MLKLFNFYWCLCFFETVQALNDFRVCILKQKIFKIQPHHEKQCICFTLCSAFFFFVCFLGSLMDSEFKPSL